MVHPQQQAFVTLVKSRFPQFFQGGRVLEIGSLDTEGLVRRHFDGADYTGLDVSEGPGVDVVCQGQEYGAPDGSFDVVISCETMEHDPFWRETFANMLRLCRPGGLVVMTCATLGRPGHRTRRTTPRDAPLTGWEYYGNRTGGDFAHALGLRGRLEAWMFCTDLSSCDLFFAGFPAGAALPAGGRAALAGIRRHYRWRNLRHWSALRQQLLIKVVGEPRYMRGFLLPWKRRAAAS